jgi:hypothetical protein
MRGHRKLQDVLVDRKVPRRERDAMPVIAAGSEVLWTPLAELEGEGIGALVCVEAQRIGQT